MQALLILGIGVVAAAVFMVYPNVVRAMRRREMRRWYEGRTPAP